jgi:hypothetical protein
MRFADPTRKVHPAVHRYLLNRHASSIKPAKPSRAFQLAWQDFQIGLVMDGHLLA